MINAQRKFLENEGITFAADNSEIHFGVGSHSRIEMEAPCELRAGRFEIDRIGAFTYLGGGSTVARNIGTIGRFCSIAPNLFAGPVEHRVDTISPHPIFEGNWRNKWPEVDQFYATNAKMIDALNEEHHEMFGKENTKISIGHNVWIGEGVFIKRGVSIGNGAVIAARSVVIHDVPPFAIVGGAPAKHLKFKFSEQVIDDFERIRWWDYGLAALDGVSFNLAETAVCEIEENINLKQLKPFSPTIVAVERDQSCQIVDSSNDIRRFNRTPVQV